MFFLLFKIGNVETNMNSLKTHSSWEQGHKVGFKQSQTETFPFKTQHSIQDTTFWLLEAFELKF